MPEFQSFIEFPPNLQDFQQTIEDAKIHTVCQGFFKDARICFKNLEKLKLAHKHFLKLFEEQIQGLSSSDGEDHLKFAQVFKKWMKDLPKILNIKSAQYVNVSKLFYHTIRKNEQKFNELYLKLTQSSGSVTRVSVTYGSLNIASSIHSMYLKNLIKFSNALLDQDETKIGYYMLMYHELLKKHFKNEDDVTIEDLSLDEEANNSIIDPVLKCFCTFLVAILIAGILMLCCLVGSESRPRRRRPAAPPG